MQQLRDHMAELSDLGGLTMLAWWDEQVTMPPQGAGARGLQLATLARLTHERATAAAVAELLARTEAEDLDALDADLVRLARRDYERAVRVPPELASELAVAASDGLASWMVARENDDFAAFAPALERNVQLAREHGRCLAEDGQSPYEALLGDYDFGLTTARLRELFGRLAELLPPLVSGAVGRGPRAPVHVPLDAQRGAVSSVLARLGVEQESWRVDVSAHPFSAWIGTGDVRITTRYEDGGLESLLSALHEYGHALYERQLDPALVRTSAGEGLSMAVHESQSKLWENHVARSRGYCGVMAQELAERGHMIHGAELHRALVAVAPSPIRVSADPVSYPLHIVLRFELELALIEGTLQVGDLPDAWVEGMRRLVGVEVPSDALGCLQDVHWSQGSFGYFPSYALGCLIAAQLWEALEAQLGDQEEPLARGETAQIAAWLREHVHRHGRRLDTLELVERATGAELGSDAFMRYAGRIAAAG